MRAAFLDGAEEIAVREVPPSRVEGHLVEIDVIACGICGSDLHGWRHPDSTIGRGKTSIPGMAGHEVVAWAPRTEGGRGRRVVLEPTLAGNCGKCTACLKGEARFCGNRAPLRSWGFSERMSVNAWSLFDVPDGMDDELASLTEPLACAVHAYRASHIFTAQDGTLAGRKVAVIGAGAIGLLATAAAARLGADAVLCVARYPRQAAAAKTLGAIYVLDPAVDDVVSGIRGFAPDVVVEAVGGGPETFDLAVRTVNPGGEVLVLGLFNDPAQLDTRRAAFRELRLFFSMTYGVIDGRHDFEVALELLRSDPDAFAGLVSHRFPLEETADAFVTAADKSTGALRIVVAP